MSVPKRSPTTVIIGNPRDHHEDAGALYLGLEGLEMSPIGYFVNNLT